ncbi:MAG: phosphatase PAP2 family protein [Bdellovibrionales bacterium]|nr:phosphatase PAP2 family protein [Bdellovibrionales bacterium]
MKLTASALRGFLWLPLAISSTALAQDQHFYLKHNQTAGITAGLTPPGDGSETDQKDIRELQQLHATRTAAQCVRARAEMNQKFSSFFGDMVPAAAVEIVRPIAEKAGSDALDMAFVLKRAFKRTRPLDRNLAGVGICPGMIKGPNAMAPDSFPSGHAAQGYMQGLVLAKIFTKNATAFSNRGREIGHSRLVLGVHHPSDVAAGQTIAQRTFDAISQDRNFVSEIEKVKEQIQAGGKALKVKKQKQENPRGKPGRRR